MKKLLLSTLLLLMALPVSAITPQKEQLRIERRDSILATISGAHFSDNQPTKSILAFGAKADGKKDSKPAFDKAMRAAAKSKTGMHLVVPAGEYWLNGPIHLVSNLCLELQEGATLRFSPEAKYYLPMVKTSWEGTFCQNYSPFIYGYQLTNVSIIGKGTIDGNCMETFATWKEKQKADQMLSRDQNHNGTPIEERNFGDGHLLRPHLIQLYDCQQVTLSDVFITNSPFWCIHLLCCEDVICRSLRYDAKLVNNDGIDPEMTRNLLIEDIDFNNGDDNVAIKAGRDNDGWKGRPSENIIIRNCRFKGLHGVVLGSELSAGIRNVFVEDCTYAGYCKRGLYVKTNPNRGGFVRDIYFKNCQFGEVEDLFYITALYAGEGADDNHFTDVRDIHVQDVTCQKVRNAAIVLQGTPAVPLTDISFQNVKVDDCKIGFSSVYTDDIQLRNCHLGGVVDGAPTQASDKDHIFK